MRCLVVVIHHYIAKVLKTVTFVIHHVSLATVVPNGDCKTTIMSIIELIITNFESISSCGNTEQHCASGESTTRLATVITTSSLLLSSTTSTLPLTSTTGNQGPTMTRERFDCIFSLLSPSVRDQRWQGKVESVNL